MKTQDVPERQGHDISLQRLEERVQVIIQGETVADTMSAVCVRETGYHPVVYVPKNDIREIDLIKCGDYDCPYKGHAELYTIRHGARDIESAAWSYDEPLPLYPELRGRVAFYPEKAEIKIGD